MMRMTSLAAAVATIAVSTVAAADPQACIAQSEQAQQARTDGRLIAARELYHACSLAECPTAIRSDCEKSFDEVDRAIPTVVVIVRSGARDLTNVRVVVDDKVVAETLDGRALALDPGRHRVHIERTSGARVDDQEIVAHEAEKNRVITFEAAPLATAASTDGSPAPQPDVRHHGAGPWIVMGAGVAIAVAGAVTFGAGQAAITKSEDGCARQTDGSLICSPPLVTPNDGSNRQTLDSNGTTMTNVGIVMLAVGGAALVAGIVWHFLEPTGPRAVTFAPFVGPRLAGASVDVRF